jgi:pyridoxal phosphate enzyme (YggS family)
MLSSMVKGVPETNHVTQDASILERLAMVRERINQAAARVGRRGEDIILVAVTKNATLDQIRQIVEAGHIDLGENRVQHLIQRAAQMDEFLQRHRQLKTARPESLPDRVRWHMIGHLQRNKVRKCLPLVRLVHSVDSLRLAEEIQTNAAKLDEPVEVLVQVNTSGETQKYGVAPAAARHLVEQIDSMLNIRPRGLMCIARAGEDPTMSRSAFELGQELFTEIRTAGVGGAKFNILSMGMSNDFEVAVECGANVVRVGQSIFGPPLSDEPTD